MTTMTPDTYRILIADLKRDLVPVHALVNRQIDPMHVTMADAYEIQNLDKAAVKKLREEEILALINYGQSYIDQYRQGLFLYKRGCINKQGQVSTMPGRTLLADFDEAEAFNDILAKVKMLKAELNHK